MYFAKVLNNKRNLIALLASFFVGMVLLMLAEMFIVTTSLNTLESFIPIVVVFLLAVGVSWLISKNWLITTISFLYFLFNFFFLFGRSFGL